MPTYQYACKDCGHSFEQVQSFSEDSLTVCPSCEGRLRKVFNAVGVVFKGSGFYRNDSRDASSGSPAVTAGSPAAAEKSEGSTTKTEPKVETKTASAKSNGSDASSSSSTASKGDSSSAA